LIAEVRGLDLLRGDLGRAAFQRGVPFQQALQVRRDPQRLADVLLDQQHGDTAIQDLRHHRVDALDYHRRQAEGHLVQQQHARVGDQRPADGDRLLLAA
jgi:hypothetical protein